MKISIDRWLDHWADHSPDKVGIEFEDQRLTYSDLTDAVGQMTSTLVGVGVGRGDRVAFLGGDGPLPLVLLPAHALQGLLGLKLTHSQSCDLMLPAIRPTGKHAVLGLGTLGGEECLRTLSRGS